MLATGILYSHSEHIQALKAQLRHDPLPLKQRGSLVALSNGAETRGSPLPRKAQVRLSAPTKASAFYNLLALREEVDPRRLTDAEVMAIRLLASGGTPREIGERLGHTTQASQQNNGYDILKSARNKMDATNNVELIRNAARYRLIEPRIGSPKLPPWTD